MNPELTQEFVTKYCRYSHDDLKREVQKYSTRDPEKILADWLKMKVYLDSKEINWNFVHDHLAHWNYDVYRLTPYWLITRNYRYYLDGFGCHINEVNGCICTCENISLECHHLNYDFWHSEAHHLDCLITLCHDCHQSISVKRQKKSIFTMFNKKLMNIANSIVGTDVSTVGTDVIDIREAQLQRLFSEKSEVNTEELSVLQQALLEINLTYNMMLLMNNNNTDTQRVKRI
jgi:hypothetical protein